MIDITTSQAVCLHKGYFSDCKLAYPIEVETDVFYPFSQDY